MPVGLNEETIKALPAPGRGNKIHYFAGAVLQGVQAPRGFGVRVTTGGAKAFVLNYRLRGREYRYTIGQYPDWKALRAVREARELRQRIDRGENPLDDRAPVVPPVAPKTVADVLDDFVTRYVRAPGRELRAAKEYESAFRRLVKPAIGAAGIYDLRRSQVAEMFDRIEDTSGPVMADRTLAYLRKAFNWYAARDDGFIPPIVKGMARTKPKERARERVLTDDEVREIWPLLTGIWGAFVKALLLTAQRRSEVAHMARGEIDKDGVWTIPAERYKTKRANIVPLSKAALALIAEQPRVAGCDYVFPSRDATPLPASGKPKMMLDAKVTEARAEAAKRDGRQPEAMAPWTLHDLRRTAKTLMARAGVRPDISERVLGHVIAGVEGVYDRHSYIDEKREALERLSAEIDRILRPTPANVVELRR